MVEWWEDMEMPSHAVHFAQYKSHHWIGIENPAPRDTMVAINWTATARCRYMFPRNAVIAKQSAPSDWHQKSGPSSIGNVWCSRL